MEIKKLTTACGAPLYIVEMPHVRSIASGILVNAGTRDEDWPRQAGLAHACEHMVFRGNAKFPDGKSLSGFIEGIGGVVNAWTWKEMTFYWNRVPDYEFDRAIEYLYYLLYTPTFSQESISKEMQTIVEEIRRKYDDPDATAADYAEEMVYGNHPLGRDTLGKIESVSSFTTSDFQNWQNAFYHPNNYSFIVVGNVKAEEALRQFNRWFFCSSDRESNQRSLTLAPDVSKKICLVNRDVEQVKLCLAVPIGGNRTSSGSKALAFYCRMLSHGMSSPLFQEVREKQGLCYEISSGMISWSDMGIFYVHSGIAPDKLIAALETIFRVISSHTRSRDLFDTTKQLLRGRLSLKYEETSSLMDKLATDVVLEGAPKTVQEELQDIENMTLERVTAVAELYLKPENFVRSIVAPHGFKI